MPPLFLYSTSRKIKIKYLSYDVACQQQSLYSTRRKLSWTELKLSKPLRQHWKREILRNLLPLLSRVIKSPAWQVTMFRAAECWACSLKSAPCLRCRESRHFVFAEACSSSKNSFLLPRQGLRGRRKELKTAQ